MSLIIVSGDDLAYAAVDGLTDPGFETRPGYCQRWVREVVQSLYGDLFNDYWEDSAAHTLMQFRTSKLLLHPAAPLSRGDLLYKSPEYSGVAGHVAIMGPNALVCENSSYHWNPAEAHPDARGTRSLTAFGPFSAIVRLTLQNRG